MAESLIRVGKVSAIDYDTGMMRVVYTDKGKAVTKVLPYMNFNDEYNMPKIGTQVLTAHLSNGDSRGVVIGPMWDKKNTPAEAGKHIYRKELSKTKGAAYIRYDDKEGLYHLKAGNIEINGINEAVLDGPKVSIEASVSVDIESAKVGVSADEYGLSAPEVSLGEPPEDGKEAGQMEVTNYCDIIFSSEENGLEAKIKKIVVETLEDMSIKAETDINLEDSGWKTTLNKIMTRLAALDGDQSDKK